MLPAQVSSVDNDNTLSGALNVKNLSSELSTVSKWYQLGIRLGLQPSQLRQIEQELPTDIDRRRIEVVDLWLQSSPGASWRHIVTALREMGDLTTAERIELKYVKGARGMTIQCNMALLTIKLCIDPLQLRHIFRGISVYFPEAAILVCRNTLALYAVSIKTCPASLVSVYVID